jgi:hypothetical protein
MPITNDYGITATNVKLHHVGVMQRHIGGDPVSMRVLDLESADAVSIRTDRPCLATRFSWPSESSTRMVSFTRSTEDIFSLVIRRTFTALSTADSHHLSSIFQSYVVPELIAPQFGPALKTANKEEEFHLKSMLIEDIAFSLFSAFIGAALIHRVSGP